MTAITENSHLDLGVPSEIKDSRPRVPRPGAGAAKSAIAWRRMWRSSPPWSPRSAPWTCMSCRRRPDPSSSPPGNKLFGPRKPPAPTTSSTWSCPRAAIAAYMRKVSDLAEASGSWVAGCGHAGDGNVHLSVFQPDLGSAGAWSTTCWRRAWPSGAPYPASTASVSGQRSRRWPSSRTPPSSACGGASRPPSTRPASSTRA